MRQAIVTKYHGCTETKPARISATASAKRVYVSWNDSLDVEANHRAAAMHLAKTLGWHGTWHGGGMPDGTGNVFVQADGPGVET